MTSRVAALSAFCAALCLILGLPASAQRAFTLIADTGPESPFSGFGFSPSLSLNDAGTVAFLADLRAGGSGLFTGSDPVADRIIGTGDALFGSVVTGLSFYRDGLNNNGELAFRATLADGRQVIARAVIPEPGTLALLAGAAVPGVGLALRRRRQGL